MRTRKPAIVFITCVAPSFARCRCGASLAGLRCWRWRERDGSYGFGCPTTCMFPDYRITAAERAA